MYYRKVSFNSDGHCYCKIKKHRLDVPNRNNILRISITMFVLTKNRPDSSNVAYAEKNGQDVRQNDFFVFREKTWQAENGNSDHQVNEIKTRQTYQNKNTVVTKCYNPLGTFLDTALGSYEGFMNIFGLSIGQTI